MSGLTSIDICRILKAAKDAGVSSLKYGGLEFNIGDDMIAAERNDAKSLIELDSPSNMDNNITSPIGTQSAPPEDEDVSIDQLALTDPVAYEEYLSGSDND